MKQKIGPGSPNKRDGEYAAGFDEGLGRLTRIFRHEASSMQEYLDFCLDEAIAITGSKIGYIYHYDEDGQRFILNTWSKDVMKECSIPDPHINRELEKTGIWGEAVRQRKPVIVNDFTAEHPLKRGYPEGHVALYRYMTIPVFSGNRIVAVAGVANKDEDYNENDVLLLALLMETVWREAERRQSEDALKERLKELQCLYDVSELLQVRTISDDKKLSGIADLLPAAMMFPDIARAGIMLEGVEYGAGAGECPHSMAKEIEIKGEVSGEVRIGYCEEPPFPGGVTFLAEERELLEEVARRIGLYFERTRAYRKIADSEQYLKTVLETSAEGYWVVDAKTRKFIDVNDAYCRMSGYTREEFLALTINDIDALESADTTGERIRRIIASGGEKFEAFHRRKDGSVFNVSLSVRFLSEGGGRFVCFARDITEWKRYEKELVNRERKHASLLRASRSVLENREFTPAARTIFDICRDLTGATAGYVSLLTESGEENEVLFLEAGGRPCSVDPKLPMPIRGLRETSYRELRAVYDNDFHHSRWMEFMPRGHVRLDNVMFAPLIVGGKAVGLIGLANKEGGFTEEDRAIASAFADIAAIALMNSRNLDSLESSIQEREMLFRELQHRVKNSFAMIAGIITLEGDRSDSDEVKVTLEKLGGRVNTLSKLYDKLYMSGDIRRVRLDEFLGQIARSLTGGLSSGVRIESRLENIVVDTKSASSYGIVLNELMTNALKYAFPGDRPGRIDVELARKDGSIVLTVSDDGAGLPEDFSMNRPKGFGTLLVGLMAKQLGGSVEVTRDRGTSFALKVPGGAK